MTTAPPPTAGQPQEALAQDELGDDTGLYLMANLFPDDTRLPFVVWISPKGHARHDCRVKVAATDRATDFIASVSVRPDVRVVAGTLSNADLPELTRWIELNRDVLHDYWDGRIQRTRDVFDRLTPL